MNLKQIEIISETKGIKIKDLAIKAEVAFSGLYRSIKENSIKASTLEKIAEILDVPISVFFGKESDLDRGTNELKALVKQQGEYILHLEKYLETNKKYQDNQQELINILKEGRASHIKQIETLSFIADNNPELKKHPGVIEIMKIISNDPGYIAYINELLKDNPEGLSEHKVNAAEILKEKTD